MNKYIPKKTASLKPYKPEETIAKIRLDANESFIRLPFLLRLRASFGLYKILVNRYPDASCERLCKAFAELVGTKAELVTAGNGSDELISLVMSAFCEKGDSVLSFEPDFSMYSFYTSTLELNNIAIKKDESLKINIKEAVEIIKEKAIKLVILSNPCSPTGQSQTKDEIIYLIENSPALVVIDEAYMEFFGESVLSLVEKYDNLIVLKTCSKAFGLAGIRLGFAIAQKPLSDALKAFKSPYNVNAITQQLGEIVLTNQKYVKKSIAKIKQSKNQLEKKLFELPLDKKGIKIYKSKTNFVTLESKKAEKIHSELIKKGICVRLLESKYLRITAGSKKENEAVLKALREMQV